MRNIKTKYKKDIKLIKSGSATLADIRNQEEEKSESSEEEEEEEVVVPQKKASPERK